MRTTQSTGIIKENDSEGERKAEGEKNIGGRSGWHVVSGTCRCQLSRSKNYEIEHKLCDAEAWNFGQFLVLLKKREKCQSPS